MIVRDMDAPTMRMIRCFLLQVAMHDLVQKRTSAAKPLCADVKMFAKQYLYDVCSTVGAVLRTAPCLADGGGHWHDGRPVWDD